MRAKRLQRLLAPLLVALLLLSGCGQSDDDGPRVERSQQSNHGTDQRSRDQDMMSGEAAGMAEEDANRLEPPQRSRPERRPEPIRRTHRSPVDQPRVR